MKTKNERLMEYSVQIFKTILADTLQKDTFINNDVEKEMIDDSVRLALKLLKKVESEQND